MMVLNKFECMHLVFISVTLLGIWGCASNERVVRQDFRPTTAVPDSQSSPFLKVHMMNGNVYVLREWKLGQDSKALNGIGNQYDFNRNLLDSGNVTIPFDSVALFETNSVGSSPAITAMAIMTGVSVAMTIFCITNPKACFGSCPTFYVWDGRKMRVLAEGFSSSIIPAFEANDVDALYRAKPTNKNLEVILTNEAMETHVIRYAHLLIADHLKGNRVFVTPSQEFYEADSIIKPISVIAPEGDCTSKLLSVDDVERFSVTDSNDLASKEEIELTFDSVPSGDLGLVLGYRQTLLTTYLFYQALAYMGNSASQWIAGVQRDSATQAGAIKKLFWSLLGAIEVSTQDAEGKWQKAGEFSEIGPIATNIELLRLTPSTSLPIKIRFKMTRGLWRLDYAALAHLRRKVDPLTIQPSFVVRGDTAIDENAKKHLAGISGPLVTLPGDRYSIIYELPSDYENYEMFLESKGYYLEWIRKEWTTEENPAMAMMIFSNPGGYLKLLAPKFKKIEPQMEDSFWRSKYVAH